MDFVGSFCTAVFHSDDGENLSGTATSLWTGVTFLLLLPKVWF
jgi:hypothetical protein